VVLADRVYLPGNGSDRAATMDRDTGEVTEAPSPLRFIRGSQSAFDGSFIYLPAKDYDEIVVIDATTLEVADTVLTLGVNSLQVLDGVLWTANNVSGFMQAFER
jgi:hypothetical protein